MIFFNEIRYLIVGLIALITSLSCVVHGYCCGCGYLAVVGPKPVYIEQCVGVCDRNDLVLIGEQEALLAEEAAERDIIKNESLNDIHEQNLKKVEEGVADIVIETPEPRIEEPPVVVEQTSESLLPSNFLHLLKYEEGNVDLNGVGIINGPFQMPYGGPTKISVPSKAVFEQRDI